MKFSFILLLFIFSGIGITQSPEPIISPIVKLLSISPLNLTTNSFTGYRNDENIINWYTSSNYCKHFEIKYIIDPTDLIYCFYWDNDLEGASYLYNPYDEIKGFRGMNPIKCTPWMTNNLITNTIILAVPPESMGFFRIKVKS